MTTQLNEQQEKELDQFYDRYSMYAYPVYDENNKVIGKPITFGPGFTGIDRGFISIIPTLEVPTGADYYAIYSLSPSMDNNTLLISLEDFAVISEEFEDEELDNPNTYEYVRQAIAFAIKNIDALLEYLDQAIIDDITPTQAVESLAPLTTSEKAIARYMELLYAE